MLTAKLHYIIPVDPYENLVLVEEANKVGILSKKTLSLVVPVDYDDIEWINDTLFLVWQNNKPGIFSTETQSLIPVDFDSVVRHPRGVLMMRKGNDRGIFDPLSKEILWL